MTETSLNPAATLSNPMVQTEWPHIEHYQLQNLLADGDHFQVFRAVAHGNGNVVALKVAKRQEPELVAQLTAEAARLGALNHPGIVQLHDSDLQCPGAWLALSLVNGQTMREQLEQAWGAQLAPPAIMQVATLLLRLADALSYLHQQGLIHADLNPANIGISVTGQPILLDFGLCRDSRLQGVSSDVHAYQPAGTPGYVAPEQARGQWLDGRADLYSLGVIAHELLVGSRPQGNKPVDLVAIRADIPVALSELVGDLLQAEPSQRPAFASDVVQRLGDCVGRDVSDQLRNTQHQPSAYFYRPALVGRTASLQTLEQGLRALGDGLPAGTLYLSGPEGSGKSRLLHELSGRAQAQGVMVINGQGARESERISEPLQSLRAGLAPLLRTVFASGIPDDVDAVVLAAAFPLYFAAHAKAHSQPALNATDISVQGMAERVVGALRDLLARYINIHGPALVVVDDHAGLDSLSAQLLEAWKTQAQHAAGLLVVTADKQFGTTTSSRHITLEELSEAQLEQWLQSALVKPVPAGLQAQLWRCCGGNLLWIEQYLQRLLEQGWLTLAMEELETAPETKTHLQWCLSEQALSDNFVSEWQDLLRQRWQHLSQPAQQLWGWLAVYAQPCPTQWLTGFAPATVRELLSSGVLRLEGEHLHFSLSALAKLGLAGFDTQQQQRWHAQCAHMLQALPEHQRSQHLAALAHHLQQAQDQAAPQAWENAGARALALASFQQAASCYEQRLNHHEDTDKAQVPWLNRLAIAQYGLGQLEDSRRVSVQTLQAAGLKVPNSGPGWTMYCLLLWLRLPWAAKNGPRVQNIEDVCQAHSRLNYLYYFAEQMAPMIAMTLGALVLGERAGRADLLARPYAQWASLLGILQRRKKAEVVFEQAASLCETNSMSEAVVNYHRALDALGLGQWQQVESRLAVAMTVIEQVNDPHEKAIVTTMHGHLEFYTGQIAASCKRYVQMANQAASLNSAQHESWGQMFAIRALLAQGKTKEAWRRFERIDALIEQHREAVELLVSPNTLTYKHAARARCLALMNKSAAALQEAELALESSQQVRSLAFPMHEAFTQLAEAFWLLREHTQAQKPLQRVLKTLKRMAGLYPVVLTHYQLTEGYSWHVRGKLAKAAQCFQQAATSAQKYETPFEEAQARMAWLQLALPDADPAVTQQQQRVAMALFRRLGCAGQLKLLRESVQQGQR